MNLLPLDQIRLNFRSHLSALRWIGLLYSQPNRVKAAGKSLRRWKQAALLLRIYLHALPYMIIICGLGRWILFGLLDLDIESYWDLGSESALFIALVHGLAALCLSLIFGLVPGFLIGLVFGLAPGLTISLAVSLAMSLTAGLASDIAGRLAGGVVLGLVVSLIVNPGFGFAVRLSGERVVALAWLLCGYVLLSMVASSTVVTPIFGISADPLGHSLALGFGFLMGFLRLYYIPFHCFWLWPLRASAYRFHPVAWDDACPLPFPGLDRLLFRYAENNPEEGEREIDRLIDQNPTQRPAALRARAILVARRAAAAKDLTRLDEILASLPAGENDFLAKDVPVLRHFTREITALRVHLLDTFAPPFLKKTSDLRHRVHEIAALQVRLDTLDRPFLREPFAALLVKEIEIFKQQIAGFKPPLSSEFRSAARQWLVVARRQLEAARAAVTREPTYQVFRAGDPVDREREAFVLRASILGELERQVMLATGCPGLLVYGRRRMGKSTLLRNLEGLLPPRMQVVSISMQEARAFTSLPDLVALISQRIAAVLPESSELPADLKSFERFLGATQRRLNTDDRRLLIAIDEYENLDSKIGEGALSEDLLAVIRESIQTHRRLIWAFAGSHGIDELVHAPWTSYLVSARTIEVTAFEPAETRLLLTEPLKHSSLWRASKTEPPRFEPGFWGEGGVERVHAEADGWPHLVQLVAETVVDLVNDAAAAVDGALLERALDRAVIRGNNVFLELLERESRLPGEWDYLRAFRRVEEQPVPDDEALDRSLRRRRLIVEEDGRYRLRVPLMARWLRQRM